MKKLLLLTAILSSGLYAASIDHIQTYSPDYLANQAQTGMINGVSAYYNPAGLGRLEKGKYFHTGFQFAHGHEKMSYKEREHKAKLNQAIPNVRIGREIYNLALKKGIFVRPIANSVYFMPPYIITYEEINKMLQVCKESIEEILKI